MSAVRFTLLNSAVQIKTAISQFKVQLNLSGGQVGPSQITQCADIKNQILAIQDHLAHVFILINEINVDPLESIKQENSALKALVKELQQTQIKD
jgi:hypothetical protein